LSNDSEDKALEFLTPPAILEENKEGGRKQEGG